MNDENGPAALSVGPAAHVQAVLLDVGGVLLLPSPDVVTGALRTVGAEPNTTTLEHAHYRAIAATDRAGAAARGSAGTSYWSEYARACEVHESRLPEAADQLVEAFTKDFGWWQIIPGSRQALARLAERVPVALVSNGDGRVEDALRKLQICQVGAGAGAEIQAIIDSGVVGVSKPDPRIFALALARLGAVASRALHIGDTLRSDLDGAQEAGIHAVHLDPYGYCPEPHGHAHAAHLENLLSILDR